MEVSDRELVIQGPPRVFIKCLSSVLFHPFIGKTVGISRAAAQLIKVKVGDAIYITGLIEEGERAARGALVGFSGNPTSL